MESRNRSPIRARPDDPKPGPSIQPEPTGLRVRAVIEGWSEEQAAAVEPSLLARALQQDVATLCLDTVSAADIRAARVAPVTLGRPPSRDSSSGGGAAVQVEVLLSDLQHPAAAERALVAALYRRSAVGEVPEALPLHSSTGVMRDANPDGPEGKLDTLRCLVRCEHGPPPPTPQQPQPPPPARAGPKSPGFVPSQDVAPPRWTSPSAQTVLTQTPQGAALNQPSSPLDVGALRSCVEKRQGAIDQLRALVDIQSELLRGDCDANVLADAAIRETRAIRRRLAQLQTERQELESACIGAEDELRMAELEEERARQAVVRASLSAP
eukprot:Hpha_TRINITY_DN17449_c0_g1::TRINITY_DN17449_c0_g1_i1::g.85829::m.85829